AEWVTLLRGLPGRLVIVNGAPASSPFIERLAGPRRIIISATDSVVQRFDTVFPEYFIAAFQEGPADIDKNGRTSFWEAFAWAAGRVRAPRAGAAASGGGPPLSGSGAGRGASDRRTARRAAAPPRVAGGRSR